MSRPGPPPPPPPNPPPSGPPRTSYLMDIKQMAARLNVPETWVRDQVTAGQIPHTRIGRHVRFTEEHFAELVAKGERRPSAPRRLAAVPALKAPGPSSSPPRGERKESAA